MERTAPCLSQFEKWTYPFSRPALCCTPTLTSPAPPLPSSSHTGHFLFSFLLHKHPEQTPTSGPLHCGSCHLPGVLFQMFNSSFLLFLQALLQHHFLKEACSDTLLNTPDHLPYSSAKAGRWGLSAVFQSTRHVTS